MIAHGVTPILNVSNFAESIAWFERLGWKKLWDWGDPPSFGAGGSGKVEIFLCHDGQGGPGRGTNTETFTAADNDKGVWMSIWVDDVDTIHQHCLTNNIEVTMPPTDFPWNTRELHIRHPDSHIFRISKGLECDEDFDNVAVLAVRWAENLCFYGLMPANSKFCAAAILAFLISSAFFSFKAFTYS